MISVSIVGGSGYAGGELLRILLNHPSITIKQVTSQRFAGLPISSAHPNLRGTTPLLYSKVEDLLPCDLLFVSLPNGVSMELMEMFKSVTGKIVDLGADFRLENVKLWNQWYKKPHLLPHLMQEFVYGIPEIYHEKIAHSNFIAGPGCEAIVSILSLFPFIKHQIIKPSPIIIDAKMGSSQAGATATSSSHHPERSGVTRSYKPTGHRHTPEIEQVMKHYESKVSVDISATSIEMVRGILVTIHTYLNKNVTEKDIWNALRAEYRDKQFIRIVKDRSGLYRLPEPKILQGSNYCDIGFEIDTRSGRLVIIGAIDNLVKGTAGNAVQCMNIMYGFPEKTGLEFPALHPI